MARLLIIVLFTLTAFGGCIGDEEAQEAAQRPVGGSTADDHAAEPGHPVNQWLLDGVRPANAATVSSGAEPSILADMDGRWVVIGDTSGLSITTNNGTSWEQPGDPFIMTADGYTLAQDDTGDLYYSTTSVSWIDVVRSSDGGRTADHTSRFVEVAPVADRPWLAARGDGEVVLLHYDFGRTTSESCARSTDGGETWLDRLMLTAGSPQGGNAAFDDDGNFYYSDDDGRVHKFEGSCLGGSQRRDFFADLGANNMVQVATQDNAVYVAAAGPGNREVLLAGAKDFGTPRTLVVSPPAVLSNTFVTVSTHEDTVAVAWYGSESAGDPSSQGFRGSFNVFVTVVQDFWGNEKQAHFRLTDEPNHVGDICMGGIGCDGSADRDLLDYFMIDHDRWGGLHVAYGHDGAGDRAEVRYGHLTPTQIDRALAGLKDVLPEKPDAPSFDASDLAPIVDFDVTADGLTVQGDATASFDPEGRPLSYQWSWGEGGAGDSARPTHEYSSAGLYDVTLTAWDESGQSAAQTQRVRVEPKEANLPPLAAMELSRKDAEVGQTVLLRDASTDPDGAIVARWWDLGNGVTKRDAHFTYAFAEPGVYTIWLSVEDDDGATDTVRQDIAVGSASGSGLHSVDNPSRSTPGFSPVALMAALLLLGIARRRRADRSERFL